MSSQVDRGFEPSHLALYKSKTLMTTVGKYAYSAVCAACMSELFMDQEYNTHFCEDYLSHLVEHLGQCDAEERSLKAMMRNRRVATPTPFLESLLKDKFVAQYGTSAVIADLVTVAVKDGKYDARHRVLFRHLCQILDCDWNSVEKFEEAFVLNLKTETYKPTEDEEREKASRKKSRKIARYAMIGFGTVVGGTIVGLTGGLAAPLIAAGAGVVLGHAGAVALGSTAGVAIISSLFGAAGAGLAGTKLRRRYGDLEEFEFEKLSEEDGLHVTIAISGWLDTTKKKKPDFKKSWLALAHAPTQYVVRYESEQLEKMGHAMEYLTSLAVSTAATEALKLTVLQGLIAAIAWPVTIVSAASVIDNPWSVLINRTEQAGKHLAEVLLSRAQGHIPVTLVGYSLGARIIFYCLQELSRRANGEGIVQDAILLGAPVPGDPCEWSMMQRAVAGRIVNGYCRSDWLLQFLYRTSSVQMFVAGLAPVEWKHSKMINVDLTNVVEGHMDYTNKMEQVLPLVGVSTQKHKANITTIATSIASTNMEDAALEENSSADVTMSASIGEIHQAESLESTAVDDDIAKRDCEENNLQSESGLVVSEDGIKRDNGTDGVIADLTEKSKGLTVSSQKENNNLA